METSELSTELHFGVDYVPSEITIENEERLAVLVNSLVDTYASYIFNDDNVPEAKEAKATLNKVKKALEDQRKDVKRNFNKPLKEFEDKINVYVTQIDQVKNGIDVGIKDFEEREKQKRLDILTATIKEMAANYEVEFEEIESEVDPTWINKTNFTKKGEVNSKTVKAIGDKLGFISLEKRRIEGDKQTVAKFAELNDLERYAWENLIIQGHGVNEVLERMNQAVEQKKLDEAEKVRKDAADKEYQEAMEKLEKEQQRAIGGSVINTETGEVIDKKVKEEIMTFTLRVSGTKEKLFALNQYMTEQGIRFEKLMIAESF